MPDVTDTTDTDAIVTAAKEELHAMRFVELARTLATVAHGDQVDKAGQPYIQHPARVAAALDDPLDKIVAWLHDVVEDTWVKLPMIRDLFGEEVADDVGALTKQGGETREQYWDRIKERPRSLRVKDKDIGDNEDEDRLEALPLDDAVRLRLKYKEARSYLWPPEPTPLTAEEIIEKVVAELDMGDPHTGGTARDAARMALDLLAEQVDVFGSQEVVR